MATDDKATTTQPTATRNAALRALPSVSALCTDSAVQELGAALPPNRLTTIVAAVLAECRSRLLNNENLPADPQAAVLEKLRQLLTPKLQPLINATGVVLHTNLGRAPVSAATASAMAAAAQAYTPLELTLATGGRGGRLEEITALLEVLTDAPAALVVNNNAAATLITLATLAAGRTVILSRGEAVEIGGGFRVPDVMRQSGATLTEVGTTNRTYIHDYAAAITPETAALLKVHSSNFRLIGFTHATPVAELVALGHHHHLPVINDLGSGALLDTRQFGLAHEPTVGESVRDGATVTLFSGDKLLGGPQAGIIVGDHATIAQISRHPLARAMRADKATLAGLSATLRHYLRGEELTTIPIWQMLAAPVAALRQRAASWQAHLAAQNLSADLVETQSTVGGGSLPGETLPTVALGLSRSTLAVNGSTLDSFAAALRAGTPAIVARITNDQLLLDPRTVLPEDEAAMLGRLTATLSQPATP